MSIEALSEATVFEEQFKAKIFDQYGDVIPTSDQLSYVWFQQNDLLRGLVLYFQGDIHSVIGIINNFNENVVPFEEINVEKTVNGHVVPELDLSHNHNDLNGSYNSNGTQKNDGIVRSNGYGFKRNPNFPETRTTSAEIFHRIPTRKELPEIQQIKPKPREYEQKETTSIQRKRKEQKYIAPLPQSINEQLWILMDEGFGQEEQKEIISRVEKLFCTEDESDSFPSVEEMFYSALYVQYELKIYSYIYRRTSDQVLSEDLSQQVFLKMFEAIQNERAWQSSFSGWLYRIAHNLVIDNYRIRDRQKNVSLEDYPNVINHQDNPAKAAEMTLDKDLVRKSIKRLTDEQAQVISLRFLEGYSFGEIAAAMDKTEGAVKALQHRAVATLRKLLDGQI